MALHPHDSDALGVLDYSNVLPGRMDEEQPVTAALRLRTIATAVATESNAGRILVRLYGGWMKDGNAQSNAASRALFTAAQADPFPLTIAGGIVHGRFELATSLLSFPEYELPDTYRVRGSVPRLRLRDGGRPSDCVVASDSCPATILKRFTKGPRKLCPTPDCSVTCETAFVHAEQKMVDTHMAADTLYAAAAAEFDFVAAVSGDTDVVPPLLQAARACVGRLALVPVTGIMPEDFVSVLSDVGVEILEVGTS